jgi:protein-S-isoprenylcysteine O-methyltransferase Ste14
VLRVSGLDLLAILVVLVMLGVIVLSVNERVRRKSVRMLADGDPPQKSSPFSVAVVDLVATAGGIYVALIALVNFLKMDVPPLVQIGGTKIEPLAALALFLAVVQPFVQRILNKNSA